MAAYKVCLHGTASVWVTVDAGSSQEANRKAVAAAPNEKHVESWTPVMTCDMNRESK